MCHDCGELVRADIQPRVGGLEIAALVAGRPAHRLGDEQDLITLRRGHVDPGDEGRYPRVGEHQIIEPGRPQDTAEPRSPTSSSPAT